MPGTVLTLVHLLLVPNPRGGLCYYGQFTDENTEAQRVKQVNTSPKATQPASGELAGKTASEPVFLIYKWSFFLSLSLSFFMAAHMACGTSPATD